LQNGRSTLQVIGDEDESLYPELDASVVNKHIKRGLAGQSPLKRGKKRALTDDDEKAIANYLADASTDQELCLTLKARGCAQQAIEGTTLQDKFKNGRVSKGYMQRLLQRRHIDQPGGQLLRSEFPQNMDHLRA
jgi:hypothetical protein